MVYCVAADKGCGLGVAAMPAFLNSHCLNKCGTGNMGNMGGMPGGGGGGGASGTSATSGIASGTSAGIASGSSATYAGWGG